MRDEVEPLYDYDVVRRLKQATMLIVHVSEPVLVLGSSQSDDLITSSSAPPRRRRRGGGGVVLLQPDDLWVDWWIPANDARYRSDVREASSLVGDWWRDALAAHGVDGEVHRGPALVDPALASVCFAGRGPGEVFVDGRKAVGVTQWRVREGSFLSTVLPASTTAHMVEWLSDSSPEMSLALDHCVVGEWAIDPDELIETLSEMSSPVVRRQLYLLS